jgi:hypothetical protein
MPRVMIGPVLPDHKKLEAEIARLRISASENFATVGEALWAGSRPLTCLGISCFAF